MDGVNEGYGCIRFLLVQLKPESDRAAIFPKQWTRSTRTEFDEGDNHEKNKYRKKFSVACFF
jgi:hypothetical protein